MAEGKYKAWQTEDGKKKLAELAVIHTDEELAAAMSISRQTLYKWIKRYGDISDTITLARTGAQAQAVNKEVEAALLKKALGYNVVVRKTFKVREVKYDKDGHRTRETEKLVEGVDEVHIPADTAAQRFWLTNRDPDRWKNKQEIDGNISGSVEEYLKKLAESGGADEM